MLSPSNIRGKTFEEEKKGYSREEVGEFLKKVANDYAAALKSNQEDNEKIIKLVEMVKRYRADEDAVKTVLINAQKDADAMLADARRKADEMIESAKTEQYRLAEQSSTECEKIVAEHKKKCAQLISENTKLTQAKLNAIHDAYESEKQRYQILVDKVTGFKSELLSLYKGQISLIMQIPEISADEVEAEYEAENAPAEEVAEVKEEVAEVKEEATEKAEEKQEAVADEENTAVIAEKIVTETVEATNENADDVVTDKAKVDKILDTGSFDPISAKQSFGDLKFGKNS